MGRPTKAQQQARLAAGSGTGTHQASRVEPLTSSILSGHLGSATGPDGLPLFDPLLTMDQLSLWLSKPKTTLYNWRSQGIGPRGIKVGNDVRFRRSHVQAWLDEHTDPETGRQAPPDPAA